MAEPLRVDVLREVVPWDASATTGATVPPPAAAPPFALEPALGTDGAKTAIANCPWAAGMFADIHFFLLLPETLVDAEAPVTAGTESLPPESGADAKLLSPR